jgi:hypothetical protein|tara:strand:- start:2061 stop:2348 length:288 start_codon:yes stop_codon:yes gene_type:complete
MTKENSNSNGIKKWQISTAEFQGFMKAEMGHIREDIKSVNTKLDNHIDSSIKKFGELEGKVKIVEGAFKGIKTLLGVVLGLFTLINMTKLWRWFR